MRPSSTSASIAPALGQPVKRNTTPVIAVLIALLHLSSMLVVWRRPLVSQCLTVICFVVYRAIPITAAFCLAVLCSRCASYRLRGVPLSLHASSIIFPSPGVKRTRSTSDILTFGKRSSIIIPVPTVARGRMGWEKL